MGGVAQTYGELPYIRDAFALGSDISEDAARGHIAVRHATEEDRADLSTGPSDWAIFLGVVDQVYGGEAAGSATEETVDTLDSRVSVVRSGRNMLVKIQASATVSYGDDLTMSSVTEGTVRTAVAGEPRIGVCKRAMSVGGADKTTIADIFPPEGVVDGAPGTAGVGSTAAEEVNGSIHKTTLTVAGVMPAIAGGADLAIGLAVYTLPVGAKQVLGSYYSLDLDELDGNITADIPDGGLGTTIASGVVAVLGGTAAFENIMTGAAFPDCNGTVELRAVPTNLSIQAADSHIIYFNIADGWAASGEAALPVAGTIVILWADLT